MQKLISLLVAFAIVVLVVPAEAQQIKIEAPQANPLANISGVCKIPFRILFELIYSIGELPIWVVRGFSQVWAEWGFPPAVIILSHLSQSAPQVFMDSIFILGFFALIELVILPFILPLVGICCVPPAWGVTGVFVLLFSIADFVSKTAQLSKKSMGGAGWIG